MTVAERQQARNQFNEAPAQPNLSYDPVADIPNEQGQVLQPQPAIPGGGAVDDPAPEPPPFQFESNDQAYRTWKLLQRVSPDQLTPGEHRRLTNEVLLFSRANPGLLQTMEQDRTVAMWKQENLDTTPHPNSRLRRAQQDAQAKRARRSYGREGVGPRNAEREVPFPTRVDMLPKPEAGSRAEYLDKREKEGLDTTSGLTTFGQEFNLARKVNTADFQFQTLYAIAKDKLEQEGITLPEGMHPLDFDEDLGQLVALVPTEDGKVKEVLVDSEFFRLADIGKVGDLEELFAMTGATLSQLTGKGALSTNARTRLAQRHPAVAEFLGDFGWRNMGLVVEYMLDAEALGGDTSLYDLSQALSDGGNLSESALGTAASRFLGRITGQGRRNEVNEKLTADHLRGASEAEDIARQNKRINDNIEESAQTLEDMQRLTDRELYYDRGQVTDSQAEQALQAGREARLTDTDKGDLASRRKENWKAYEEATDKIHNNRLSTPDRLPTDAEIEDHLYRAGDARVERSRDIGVQREDFGDMGDGRPQQSHYQYRWRQGRGHTSQQGKLGSTGDLHGASSGASVVVDHQNNEIIIERLFEDAEFPGGGAMMLERILADMGPYLNGRYRLYTDKDLSQFSGAMLRKLNSEGLQIRPAEDIYARGSGERGDTKWYSGGAEPVAEIVSIPGGVFQSIPVVADTPRLITGSVELSVARSLDNMVNAEIATIKSTNDFMGAVGWNPDKGRGIYKVVNPANSKLRRTAKQIIANRNQSLTGQAVSKENQLLNSLFVKSQDEEGFDILTGLVNDELDMAQLFKSREVLLDIADRTNDPRIYDMYDYVDHLLTNGKVVGIHGPVDEAQRASFEALYKSAKANQQAYKEAHSMVTGSQLFRRENGEFVNIEDGAFADLMNSGSKFHKHIAPWMKASPDNRMLVQSALVDVYEKKVLQEGWTFAKHQAFFDKYGVALRNTMSPEDYMSLLNTRWTSDGLNPFIARAQHAAGVMNRVRAYGEYRPNDPMGSLNDIGRGIDAGPGIPAANRKPQVRVRSYLNEVGKVAPQALEDIRNTSLRQVNEKVRSTLFGPKASAMDQTQRFNEMWDWLYKDAVAMEGTKDSAKLTNAMILEELHGKQYVNDLYTIMKSMRMDLRRFATDAEVAVLQGDVVKTSRTLMGPLNVWQRRVSAANWIRLSMQASRAMDTLSNPESIRHLVAAKGYPVRSRPGMAALYRSGILPGEQWDGEGELPTDLYQKGLEYLEWLQGVADYDASF